MKTAFIGHRQIFADDINERLASAILTEIENGCKSFTMGTHGKFDSLALATCQNLRKQYKDIEIEVVLTSLHSLEKYKNSYKVSSSDIKTVIYGIEDTHYKRQISSSNRLMIDTCDTLICYVDNDVYRSGAKSAMLYAKKRGLKIVNLYREEDNIFYGMTEEEKNAFMKDPFSKF